MSKKPYWQKRGYKSEEEWKNHELHKNDSQANMTVENPEIKQEEDVAIPEQFNKTTAEEKLNLDKYKPNFEESDLTSAYSRSANNPEFVPDARKGRGFRTPEEKMQIGTGIGMGLLGLFNAAADTYNASYNPNAQFDKSKYDNMFNSWSDANALNDIGRNKLTGAPDEKTQGNTKFNRYYKDLQERFNYERARDDRLRESQLNRDMQRESIEASNSKEAADNKFKTAQEIINKAIDEQSKLAEGGRNVSLNSIVGKLSKDAGLNPDSIMKAYKEGIDKYLGSGLSSDDSADTVDIYSPDSYDKAIKEIGEHNKAIEAKGDAMSDKTVQNVETQSSDFTPDAVASNSSVEIANLLNSNKNQDNKQQSSLVKSLFKHMVAVNEEFANIAKQLEASTYRIKDDERKALNKKLAEIISNQPEFYDKRTKEIIYKE